MIYAVTNEASLTEMLHTLDQMKSETVRDGLYEVFFTDFLPTRQIIFPCTPKPQIELVVALEMAMQSIQDSGCYLDVLGLWQYTNREGQVETTSTQYCYVSLDQFIDAIDKNGAAKALKNQDEPLSFFIDHWAMYSIKKQWGIHINGYAEYALLGGTKTFMNAFDRNRPSTLRSIEEFLSYWKKMRHQCEKDNLEAPWNWLTRLMIHVYGKEQAFELMDEARMFDN
jgi:hypothetical protein